MQFKSLSGLRSVATAVAFLAATAMITVSCKRDGPEEPPVPLALGDPAQTTQTALTDQTATGGLSFTAREAWTVTVVETTPELETTLRAAEGETDGTAAKGAANGAETAGTVSATAEATAYSGGNDRIASPQAVRNDGTDAGISVAPAATGGNEAPPATAAKAGTIGTTADATAGITRASTSGMDWLRVKVGGAEKYSGTGSAAAVNAVIELDPNYTGVTRTATVTIAAGGESIPVSVSQNKFNARNEVPVATAARQRIVSVTSQTGTTLAAGTAGSIDYIVKTVCIAAGTTGTVQWFADAPAGITATPAGIYHFRVTIGAATSAVQTLTVSATTVTVGAQEGVITEGYAHAASFAVTAAGIADNATGAVQWFADAQGNTPADASAWLREVEITSVRGGRAGITIYSTAEAVRGDYWFRATFAGVQSANVAKLIVSPPGRSVAVAAQTGALTAGSAGEAAFAVTTAEIADGAAGTVQ